MVCEVAVFVITVTALPAALGAQKNCKKGVPCGGACISASKTCHIGEAAKLETTARQGEAGPLEGDVYLVTKSGDIKRGAGRTVLLIADTDSLAAVGTLLCSAHHAAQEQLRADWLAAQQAHAKGLDAYVAETRAGVQYSDARQQALRTLKAAADSAARRVAREPSTAFDRLLARFATLTQSESSTGMSAHYTFPALPIGKYVLLSEWTIGDIRYVWWRRARVAAAIATTVDLDNGAIVEIETLCLEFR